MSEMINEAWEAHQAELSRKTEKEAARAALFTELLARKNALQEVALGLLARTGSTNTSYVDDITDEQLSPAIPLGKFENVDAEGRSFAFAHIFVAYDQEAVERTVKGRFFKRTEFEYVRSDKINSFGVRLMAAHEDGSNATYVDGAYWHIANGYDSDEFDHIEGYFTTITAALDKGEPVSLTK